MLFRNYQRIIAYLHADRENMDSNVKIRITLQEISKDECKDREKAGGKKEKKDFFNG